MVDVETEIALGEAVLSLATERCVSAHVFDGCRGLRADRDIEPGETVLKVPLSCCLSLARARESLGATAVEGLSEQSCLILALLSERGLGTGSALASYIGTLPSHAELNASLFWTEEELQLLHGEASVRAAAIKEAVQNHYSTVVAERAGRSLPEISEADYIWGQGILNSRQFHLASIDGGLLIPCVDLANHDPTIKTFCVFAEEDSIVVRATRHYKAHEEFFITYGAHSNAELLTGYGFVKEDNPTEAVVLFLDVSHLAPELQEAALKVAVSAASAGCKVEGMEIRCSIQGSDSLPDWLVELAQASVGGCLRAGLASLLGQLGQLLQRYPSVTGTDSVDRGSMPLRHHCAVVCHRGERQVLLNAIKRIIARLVQLLAACKLPQQGIQEQQPRVVEMYSRFSQLPPCPEIQAQWVVFATAAFLGLYGRSEHACAQRLFQAAERAPTGSVFTERMGFWGCYLASQFCVTGSIARDDATSMLMESTDLRNSVGWSIPTTEAIAIVAEAPQPIEVLGSPESAAPWAAALRSAGLNVIDGSGGSRTRVVVWPDPGGEGPAGLAAVASDLPEMLICIGEWEGSTLGLLPGVEAKAGGQAWSVAAQKQVASEFCLRSETYLPSWPLACDRLAVYARNES